MSTFRSTVKAANVASARPTEVRVYILQRQFRRREGKRVHLCHVPWWLSEVLRAGWNQSKLRAARQSNDSNGVRVCAEDGLFPDFGPKLGFGVFSVRFLFKFGWTANSNWKCNWMKFKSISPQVIQYIFHSADISLYRNRSNVALIQFGRWISASTFSIWIAIK